MSVDARASAMSALLSSRYLQAERRSQQRMQCASCVAASMLDYMVVGFGHAPIPSNNLWYNLGGYQREVLRSC